MKHIIKLMRLHHGIKSILVFLPIIFSGRLFELPLLLSVLAGFLSFVLLSSSVYCINDVFDREKDRLHPTKKNRPVASGAVSVRAALILAVCLIVLSVLIDRLVSKNLMSLPILLLYLGLNLSYSAGLKEIPMVDIVILVSGFLLRVLYGSVISDIPVSNWLYLTVISMSFYLGLGKRRNEYARSGESTRKVLKHYTYEFLDKNMYISNALTLIFYSLWCTASELSGKGSGRLVWTVPLVMLISMKYSLNVEASSDGDPVEVLIHDRSLMVLSGVYAVVMFLLLYA